MSKDEKKLKKILVIEDNKEFLENAKKGLKENEFGKGEIKIKQEFEVLTATTLEEAERIKKENKDIRLVFSDWNFPKKEGEEPTESGKEILRLFPEIPIVVVTKGTHGRHDNHGKITKQEQVHGITYLNGKSVNKEVINETTDEKNEWVWRKSFLKILKDVCCIEFKNERILESLERFNKFVLRGEGDLLDVIYMTILKREMEQELKIK